MKVLVTAIHYPVASGRYVLEALRNMGVEAYSDGPSTGRSVWGSEFPSATPWIPDAPKDFFPDLVIVADSDDYILNGSKLWDGVCPIVVYGVDNHVRYYRRAWIDHYYVGHKAVSIHKYGEDTTWLPCATSSAYTQSPIPWAEREYDVGMVGVPYAHRITAINELQTKGLKVFAAAGLFDKHFAHAYHNCRIALSVSSNGDLAQRVFETAALGCLVLSDDVRDLREIGKGPVFVYGGKEEPSLVEAVNQLLVMSPESAEKHIVKTVTWASAHTWEERLKIILGDYGNGD
jgi:hypothetical protein